jgi:hypothetical protein
MSSHPGSELADALDLALFLRENKMSPEQVQDFYPTPGTVSTAMYFCGINPMDGKKVYAARDYREKRAQRAMLQTYKPENREIVLNVLKQLKREDLIGVLLPRPDGAGIHKKFKKETGGRKNGENIGRKGAGGEDKGGIKGRNGKNEGKRGVARPHGYNRGK